MAKCFFTLTDRRVLVHSFAALTGAPKDLLAAYPLTDFASLETEKGTLVSKLTLWMADGTSVPLDVFRGGGGSPRPGHCVQPRAGPLRLSVAPGISWW